MFRTVPLSIFRSFFAVNTAMVYVLTDCEQDQEGTSSVMILLTSCQQTCMIYNIAVCTVRQATALK